MRHVELSVLLVEDNPAEVQRLTEMLSQCARCDMKVRPAGNFATAKEALSKQRFDAILLDWFLPDRHGVESLGDLQRIAPKTPVLMLAGWDDEAGAIEALRAGVQDVLVKDRLTASILERTIRYAVERKRTEAALRQTEEMYRSLIESLPISVFRKDRQGRFVFANQRFCDLLHKRLDDLVGNTDYSFFPTALAEKYRQDDLKVIQQRRAFETIEDHSTPDGQRMHVQVMKAPATDATGRVVGTQSMFWDVTARVEAEEALQRSHARFKKLFDANIIGIMLADLTGRILEANEALLSLVGYSRDDLVTGRLRWDRITPPEFRDLDLKAIDSLNRTGICPPWEKEYFRRDGSRVPVMVGVSMLDNSSSECICFVLDMTEQRKIQEQLRHAKEEADAANQAKSLFLANMSHEIRTPMNAIIGLTELVLDSPLTPRQRDHLTAVADSAESLLSLINHILDFSKIEAGKLELDEVEFSLRTMIAGTMKTLALAAHRKRLELVSDIRPDVPDRLLGDAVRLRQVILNLLGNAIKFTDSGEVVLRVSIRSRVRQTSAEELELQLEVQDTGIGIPPDRQEAVFEAFEQVHTSTNRKYGGTGLGLSITAKLAQLMRGQAWLTSQVGQGSTFYVTCRVKVAAGETTTSVPNESPMTDLRVLIVDDNATSRGLLSELLSVWRMRPTAVSNAKEAIRVLENFVDADQAFAFTIIDSQMPGIDGFELAATIHAGLESRAGQLLILLSSPDRAAELARCEQLGLMAAIAKPINESELLDTFMSLRLGNGGVEIPTLPSRERPAARAPLRVLLVEDSLFNQKLAVALLTKRGHSVIVANNGREAIDWFFRETFDRVLMDIQMPDIDGLEATQTIREREARQGTHIPIIAMTAQALTGDRERCLAVGMDEYLTKPIRSDLLFQLLESEFPQAVYPQPMKTKPASRTNSDRTSGKAASDASQATSTSTTSPTDRPLNVSNGQKPSTELVNWPHALAMVANDAELLRDVVAACLEDFPKWLRDLETGLANNEAPPFRRAAHSLRGASRTFGLERLAAPLQDLEMLAQAGNLAAAGQLLETLRPDLQSCVAELQGFLTKP